MAGEMIHITPHLNPLPQGERGGFFVSPPLMGGDEGEGEMYSQMKGVTLIELIIVLAIIGIVAALATISVSWFMRETRVSESRDRLLADIEDVKLKSLAGVPHAIYVVGTTSYRAVRLTDDAGSDFKRDTTDTEADGDIIPVANFTSPTLPSNMRLQWSDGTEIWFDRKGTPRSSTWGVNNGTFTIWYDTETVNNSPDSNEQQKKIVISRDGRIKYEQ